MQLESSKLDFIYGDLNEKLFIEADTNWLR